MERLGTIEEITNDGRFIVRCSTVPEIGDHAFIGERQLGTIGRVFGPIDEPYASVNPCQQAVARKGDIALFKGRKRDAKRKGTSRRNRGMP